MVLYDKEEDSLYTMLTLHLNLIETQKTKLIKNDEERRNNNIIIIIKTCADDNKII